MIEFSDEKLFTTVHELNCVDPLDLPFRVGETLLDSTREDPFIF